MPIFRTFIPALAAALLVACAAASMPGRSPATADGGGRDVASAAADASSSAAPAVLPAGLPVHAYAPDPDAFDNPERGFYSRIDLLRDKTGGRVNAPTTLVHSYVRLDVYRDRPLTQELLTSLAAGFDAVRAGGKKVIVRFSYNFGPYPNCEPDAPLERIMQHIGALAPTLHAHADVIAWFEAGFIGCWGEWHTSSNRLDRDSAAKQRIVSAMLALWPARGIQIRYPSDLRLLRGGLAPTADVSRLGFHNDCVFASDPDDYGTWNRGGNGVDNDKRFVAEAGLSAPIGGETCALSVRSHCATALAEFAAQRWTDLNAGFSAEVLDQFRAEGCFDEIDRRLGYRFTLLDAAFAESASPGGSFRIAFRVRNDGWAAALTSRRVNVVLDGGAGRWELPLTADVKTWQPGATTLVDEAVTLPADLPSGRYRLSLAMPDPAEGLRTRAAFAIRFANLDVWDAETGLNVIAGGLRVGDVAASGEDAGSAPDGP